MATHLIGLMLGTEDDWPTAFEALVRRAGLRIEAGGETHAVEVERMAIEPFRLRARPAQRLVIDRLAWWYHLPREWLKKAAIMDEVYLLNDPFTFQSMEKHTAYCAMMRLGLEIPETWMLPLKEGPANERYVGTARRYNQLFSLEKTAERVGYPLYMKPFDGGGWVGVTRIEDAQALHAAYDASGQRLMHIQKAIDGYDLFARTLSIGPTPRVMRYCPERPLHERYAEDLPDLAPDLRREIETISLLINAFFRWEFNSSETIVDGAGVHPIDFANACPDVSIISLHRHFPWAMTALVKWSVFCCVTGRKMAIDMDKRRYFELADRTDLSPAEKLEHYRRMAEAYFQADDYLAFADRHLGVIDEVADAYFASDDFDQLLRRTVMDTFPAHEHDWFIERYRARLAARNVETSKRRNVETG